jgi:hypothetical protein
MQLNQRNKVFISYSHQDQSYLKRLQTHLAPYIRGKTIDVWDDTRIKAGGDWLDEIKQTLEETRVAVLLVSVAFRASDFITNNELPPLLEAAENGGAIILSVIVDPCNFEDTPLYRYQAVNNPRKPLSKMKTAERDEVWVRLVKRIQEIVL